MAVLAFDERLGFSTRKYDAGYTFANRDQVELHLGVVPGDQPQVAKHATYLWVDDAGAIAREWQMAVSMSTCQRTPSGVSTKELLLIPMATS